MNSEMQRAPGTDSLPSYVLPELEPRTAEALIGVLSALVKYIEYQHDESLHHCYAADAQHAAREQLSLNFFDDSDIAVGETDSPPF